MRRDIAVQRLSHQVDAFGKIRQAVHLQQRLQHQRQGLANDHRGVIKRTHVLALLWVSAGLLQRQGDIQTCLDVPAETLPQRLQGPACQVLFYCQPIGPRFVGDKLKHHKGTRRVTAGEAYQFFDSGLAQQLEPKPANNRFQSGLAGVPQLLVDLHQFCDGGNFRANRSPAQGLRVERHFFTENLRNVIQAQRTVGRLDSAHIGFVRRLDLLHIVEGFDFHERARMGSLCPYVASRCDWVPSTRFAPAAMKIPAHLR
ncbi:hypothetical protein SC318_03650 [Pseudomonas sp. MUP55]|nr:MULTISPECIES: hypothetical protein [unclassified Pseudomonas]WPN93484.1 hypothetical protein SC319_03650 [Pseudomonas sp. MUP56]WPN99010.1 hypothetical protein SC318_03650 [Pseudomonas sp. MUP55]